MTKKSEAVSPKQALGDLITETFGESHPPEAVASLVEVSSRAELLTQLAMIGELRKEGWQRLSYLK